MAIPSIFLTTCFLFLFALQLMIMSHVVFGAPNCGPIEADDRDRIQFALNLEFLEAEFFLNAALGRGLDSINSSLSQGGPPPIGAQKAILDPLVYRIIEEFAYQEVGHIRAIVTRVGGFPRPLLNLSRDNFAKLFEEAAGFRLIPPFNPYANSINYLLSVYAIPYVGLVGYVGTIPSLNLNTSRSLVAKLLAVEAGQDAVIRALLYERAEEPVSPYGIKVATFTNYISRLRNTLAGCGIKDEGIIVPLELGAENRTTSNVLSADTESLGYSRTPPEILRILYATGSENRPGGFFPEGANGNIARRYLTAQPSN